MHRDLWSLHESKINTFTMETCSEFFWDLGFHRGIEVQHEARKLMSECFADGNLKNSFSISNDANLTVEMEFANISNRLI
jgi:hypothetical protein